MFIGNGRAQPEWAFEFPDQTEPDTEICRTGPTGPTKDLAPRIGQHHPF